MLNKPEPMVTKAQRAYGGVVSRMTLASAVICIAGPVIAMLRPLRNFLNPHLLFSGIWDGKSVAELWDYAGGGFPGGHFYIGGMSSGDGLIQLGIVIGSTAALWGLLSASAAYISEKLYGYAAACILLCVMIVLAMSGMAFLV